MHFLSVILFHFFLSFSRSSPVPSKPSNPASLVSSVRTLFDRGPMCYPNSISVFFPFPLCLHRRTNCPKQCSQRSSLEIRAWSRSKGWESVNLFGFFAFLRIACRSFHLVSGSSPVARLANQRTVFCISNSERGPLSLSIPPSNPRNLGPGASAAGPERNSVSTEVDQWLEHNYMWYDEYSPS